MTRTLVALELLRQLRFLTDRQLRLSAHCTTADLDRLRDSGCVVAFPLVDPFEERDQEQVFALARAGAHLLIERLGYDRTEVPYLTPSRAHRSLVTLRHTLARNEFALALQQATSDTDGIDFVRWEHAPHRIGDSVHLYDDRRGALRVPIVADGLALLRCHDQLHGLLVETDRGTVGLPRMTLRYRGYQAWWRTGGAERRFGVRAIRVLTVAPTERRAESLRQAARKAIHRGAGTRLLWFATQPECQIGQDLLHKPLWWLAHSKNTHQYPLFS